MGKVARRQKNIRALVLSLLVMVIASCFTALATHTGSNHNPVMQNAKNTNRVLLATADVVYVKNFSDVLQVFPIEPAIPSGVQEDFSSLVENISSVYVVGVPGPLWALSENVVPIVSGDEDTTPVPSVVAAAVLFGNGRVVALGHEGFLTNESVALFDNKKFGLNIVKWLDKSGSRRVLVTTGHREWLGGENFESFKRELESLGYTVTRFSGQISASELSGVGVVLIGNAWGDFTREEVEELQSFVYKGGGLLLMGLGWSWEPNNPGRTLDDYPMNKIGEVFGIRWIDGYITDPTNSYNGQPVFHTFYPNIKLQTLYQAFSYIKAVTEAHPTDLPTLLQTNITIRRDYVNAHLLLATASRVLSTSSNASLLQRREIYDFYKELINSNPQYFGKNIVFDRGSQSVMAWLRERVYRSFIDALPLTEDVKNEVASTMGLTGRYLDLWNNFTVLLLDNNGLDQKQLDFIYALLSAIPRELHNLRAISVTDFLGELPPSTPEIYLWGREGGVNISGLRIGEDSENDFPEDVPPKYSDVFCIVVAHEVNHVVDAFYISRNATLSTRRDELIKRAGNDHLNYLRSMLPDGFFTSNPQEFFASISNQWFSDSALTLKLALARFDKGYKEPLNQFLFFAEVYSRGGNVTLFYSMDTHGNLQRREVPLLRDQKGRIVGLRDGDTWYLFTLDEYGNVMSYTVRAHAVDIVTIVRGGDNSIYYKPCLSGCSYVKLSGATPDSPSALIVGNRLYIAVRGADNKSIYFGRIDSIGNSSVVWQMLPGFTPSRPALATDGSNIYLVVRGGDNRIYVNVYTIASGTWSGWKSLSSGSTVKGPAATYMGGKLHLVVIGADGKTIYYGQVDPSTLSVTWAPVSGSTDSEPSLATDGSRLYLVVKGYGTVGAVYVNVWSGSWSGWERIPTGSTPSGPAAAIWFVDGNLYIIVRGGNNQIYYTMRTGYNSYTSWSVLGGTTPSSPSAT